MDPITKFSGRHFPFPLHGVLVWHRGKLLQEEYFSPYSPSELHRMFSVTKSFTALAVGGLIAEGKLALTDKIIRFFPEYVPGDPHPYLAEMTIADMLSMRTCYKSTTYKIDPSSNWVQSFFTTPPDHRPGQIFRYDTSSAHTLAALVKKLSGLGVLDYLRTLYLDVLGFSADAYILTDPFGAELGGSGLLARPGDLLLTGRLLLALCNGTDAETYPEKSFAGSPFGDPALRSRYREFIRECMSYQTSTFHDGKTLDECQGYGRQFWMVRDGVVMYGMGGQYLAMYPENELIVVTCADTQAVQGGTQIILDEIRRVYLAIRRMEDAGRGSRDPGSPRREDEASAELLGAANYPTLAESPIRDQFTGFWTIRENPAGFRTCTITEEEVVLESSLYRFSFPLAKEGFGKTREPHYNETFYVWNRVLPDGCLCLYVQIMETCIGNIRIVIKPSDGKLTICMHKIEESLFGELDGFLEGIKI